MIHITQSKRCVVGAQVEVYVPRLPLALNFNARLSNMGNDKTHPKVNHIRNMIANKFFIPLLLQILSKLRDSLYTIAIILGYCDSYVNT